MLNTNREIRKEKIRSFYKENFPKYGTVIGTVIGYNDYGCYVRDSKSKEIVFYYGNGFVGDRVQLSVKKADVELERITCILESVIEYGDYVA